MQKTWTQHEQNKKNLHIPILRNLRSIGKKRNDMCLAILLISEPFHFNE